MRCRRAVILLGGCLACVYPPYAGAASCEVSTAGLVFGAYDPMSPTPLDSAAGMTVRCDTMVMYTVASSGGEGGLPNRRMLSAGQALRYNLYTDPALLVVWGDGSAGTATMTGTGTTSRLTVYGRVPARQNVGSGAYLDNITVTVTY